MPSQDRDGKHNESIVADTDIDEYIRQQAKDNPLSMMGFGMNNFSNSAV